MANLFHYYRLSFQFEVIRIPSNDSCFADLTVGNLSLWVYTVCRVREKVATLSCPCTLLYYRPRLLSCHPAFRVCHGCFQAKY